MKKTLLHGVPNTFLFGFLVLVVLTGVFLLSRSGAFTQTGLGSCGTLNSLSSQMQYSQVGSLLDTIASAINPAANTLGVFKGTIQFSGPCETVTGTRLNTSDKQANVSTFDINLQQLSCDYNLVPDPSTAQGFGRAQQLSYTAVTFPSRLGQGTCSIDLAAIDPVQYALNSPLTYGTPSTGSTITIPVSCESYYTQQCELNAGYSAYFDSSHRTGAGGTSLVTQEPAACGRVQSSGPGQLLTSQGAAFKPNARVLINYNNQQITLDTANGVTGAATADRNAYFMLNRNTGTFSQNCPTNIVLYYRDSVSRNMVSPEYLTTLKNSFTGISAVQGQRNLLSIQSAVSSYNNLLSNPVVVNSNLTYTVGGNGQQLSIDRLNDPNINPAVDFIIVASQVSVAAQVANPTFVSTNPASGRCLQTTSVQPTSVSATLTSFTPGNVLVNVNCNTPLGLRTSSQQLTFSGGDTKTANFAITVPANNYSCTFIASNQALGQWNQVAQSTSFCVQSTQAVFEQCSAVGSGSLKTNDPVTGRCVCQLTQTQGQNVCGSSGQTYDANSCSCISVDAIPNSCAGQPLSCPGGQILTRNNVGCNVCSLYNQTSNITPPATCAYPTVPVTTVQHSVFESIPLIGGAFQPTITTTCTLDPNILIVIGIIVFAVVIILGIYLLSTILRKGGRRK